MSEAKKIVIINDNKYFMPGMITMLRHAGFEVATLNSVPEELVKACAAEKPDLILCDTTLPVPNGVRIKTQLNGDPVLAQVPFLLLSGETTLDDRLSCLKAGADDCITRPVEVNELVARMQAVLRRDDAGYQRGLHAAASTSKDPAAQKPGAIKDRLIDPLTGELNCDALDTLNTGSFSFVVMIDLDPFIESDNRGERAVGDQSLAEFTQTCRRNLRGDDVIIRWSDDTILLALSKPAKLDYSYLDVDNIVARIQKQWTTSYPEAQMSLCYGSVALHGSLHAAVEIANRKMNEMKQNPNPVGKLR